MFALADTFDFLAHKLSRLCARRFTLARVPTRALDGFSFRHENVSFSRGSGSRRASVALSSSIGCRHGLRRTHWTSGCGCGGFGLTRAAQLAFRLEPMFEVLAVRLAAFDEYLVRAPGNLFLGGGRA